MDAVKHAAASTAPANAVLAMLLEALACAPHDTAADRRAIYSIFQERQERKIKRTSPSEETIDFLRRQLRMVIRLLEADIRAGKDVFAAAYVPATLADEDTWLTAGHEKRAKRRRVHDAREARRQATRNDSPFVVALPPDETMEMEALRSRLLQIHAKQAPRRPVHARSGVTALLPLFILQLHIIHSESRIALLWALIGPAVLLGLISSLYILTGSQYILGMDVPTFSLLGATTWIMFRQIIFRTSSSYVSARSLLNLKAVTPLALALVQSLIYLMIYLVVYAVLLTIGYYLGLTSLAANWPGFIFYVVMIAIGGASIGLIFGCIATNWRFFLRLASVLERLLEVFSGVFFVSEQLPVQYRPYFLWSPFAHGMQLLRSAFFSSYKSHDASLAYFLTSLAFLAAIGLAAERRARCKVQPTW